MLLIIFSYRSIEEFAGYRFCGYLRTAYATNVINHFKELNGAEAHTFVPQSTTLVFLSFFFF